MIAKIGKGDNLLGALLYNQSKVDKENGVILYTKKVKETLNNTYTARQLYQSFEPYLSANVKTEKPSLHISMNPDPKDKVSDEQFVKMAQEYMEGMGYGNQPYIVFKHTDIERTHIHIVSTSVGIDGKKISDAFDHPRSMAICRELEKKYHLLSATEQSQTENKKLFKPLAYKEGDMKSQIASIVRNLHKYYQFQSLGEYNALLSLFNISVVEVNGELKGIPKRGLVYFGLDDEGKKISNPFKASLFGKGAGYTMLMEHFEKSAEILKKHSVKTILKKTIEIAVHTSNDELSFKKQLLEQGINTVVRRNEENRIYGITFIDHNSKTVINGSRLSKELSANFFNAWWSDSLKSKGTEINEIVSTSPKGSTPHLNSEESHQLFDFLNTDNTLQVLSEDSVFGAIGGLLPEALGEDTEELEFANQIRKRRKVKPRRSK